MQQTIANRASLTSGPEWHSEFLAMLPVIERCAQQAFRRLGDDDRREAVQAVVAYATVAYAKLVRAGRADLGYATPLARYGVKQYRAGRIVGSRNNARDVNSIQRRRRGCVVEPLDDWKETLCDSRRATPAEIAALRIDLGDWLKTLSPRDQKVARALAQGEQTSGVARMFGLTSGRVSQLRRELFDSWRRFTGELVALAS